MPSSRPSGLMFAVCLALSGCKAGDGASGLKEEVVTAPLAAGPRLCTAHRGNGNLIMSHFGALARIVEHYGLVDGMAGGSSGSITVFFYESMFANPLLKDCGNGAACSEGESVARVALLLKSMQGYVEALAQTDEAVAFQQLAPILAKAKAAGIDKLMASDVAKARDALIKLFQSQDLRDIINKEVITLLQTSPNPDYHTRDVWDYLSSLGNWKAEDPKIFIRPGIIDFKALARKMGRIANFYAGYGPYDTSGMQAFFGACAAPSRGKTWTETAALEGPGGKSCGESFGALLKTYRKKLIATETTVKSRVDDPVGKYLPSLIMTSLLEGADAAARFKKARDLYLDAKPIAWSMDFDLVKIGYWGQTKDLERVAKNERQYEDIKTAKLLSLGERAWVEALSYSPAEPGLTRFQEMSPTRVSSGGWPDLFPTLVLKNLGCQNVVYVTRRGDESTYITGVTKLLGMTAAQEKAYFSLDTAEGEKPSALALAVSEADGVWCTNWSAYETGQIAELSDHSYNAPFEARTPFFAGAFEPYPNAAARVNLRACTPGAPADAL